MALISQLTPKRFQILALDGGGIRGIFTAALLASIEADLGRPVLGHFDLVVGTSTGGIVALGLGAGLTPREILEFYVDQKHRVFPPGGWPALRQLYGSKYSSVGLKAALQDVLGPKLLGESQVPLVIPAFNLSENDVYLFKTPHNPRFRRDYKVPMWAVAMATSAAPTFFPAFTLPSDKIRLIDGGVWANNPALVGVAEATSSFGQRLEDIRLLSVGTTVVGRDARHGLDAGGFFQWVTSRAIPDVFLDGQSAAAFAQVQHFIGKPNAYRLNPTAPKGLAGLDACDADELIAKAAHYSRHFTPTFVTEFGSHVPAPFIPFVNPIDLEGTHAAAGSN